MSRRPSRPPSPRSRPVAPPTPPSVSTTHPAHLVALGVAFACVLASVSFRMYDLDVWQHLAFGRAMASLGEVPRTQLWTWPTHGAPVVNPSWGFSWLLWPFWTAGGVWGLAAWRWLTTAIVAALVWATARRLGVRAIPTLVTLVLCGLVIRSRSQARPETLALVWLAAVPFVLHAVRRTAWRDALLVAIGLAWANSHLSWWWGPLLVVLHAAGSWRSPSTRRDGARLLLVAFAMVAVAFVNPYGPELVLRPWRFVSEWRHDPFLAGISELQPLDWRMNLSNGLPLLLLGAPLLAWARARRHGFDLVETLVLVVFLGLALQGSRFVAPAAVVVTPWFARDLEAWLATWRGGPLHAAPWRQTLAFALVAPLVCLPEWTGYEGRFGVAPDLRRAPVAACDFIEAHGVRGRMLNDFFLGGYVLWRAGLDPARAPFLDIHPEDAPAELRAATLAAFTSRRGFEALEARWRFDHVLLSRSPLPRAGLADLLDRKREWALVCVDDAAALYVRRDGPLAAVADSFAYPLLPGGALALDELTRACAADTALARQVWGELERQRASSPAHASFAALRATCATTLGASVVTP